MHPLIAADPAGRIVDDRPRDARRAVPVAPSVITPQRALVRESLVRYTPREERA
jgi:hypothetical protein